MNRQTIVSVKGPCWQDIDRRVPATAIGQPVAVAENIGLSNGQKIDAVQSVASRRPVISAIDETGYTLLCEVATEWTQQSYLLPQPRWLDVNGKTYLPDPRRPGSYVPARADLCADPALLAEAVEVLRNVAAINSLSGRDHIVSARDAARAFIAKWENRHDR